MNPYIANPYNSSLDTATMDGELTGSRSIACKNFKRKDGSESVLYLDVSCPRSLYRLCSLSVGI